MTSFRTNGDTRSGYLALPAQPTGRGVLVLHAWWGLNDFFKSVCDRLAEQGFVAFAPDLHHGMLANTVEDANQLLETRDRPAARATAEAALRTLHSHPAVRGEKVGAVGFSMGASYAALLDSQSPGSFAGIVFFYGEGGADVSQSSARFQAHYGEVDEWEPMENVKKMTAGNIEVFTYPDTGHWFVEQDRPDHYKPQAAELAWRRTVNFLAKTLVA
jgi:carboxymethylenebutenolidase